MEVHADVVHCVSPCPLILTICSDLRSAVTEAIGDTFRAPHPGCMCVTPGACVSNVSVVILPFSPVAAEREKTEYQMLAEGFESQHVLPGLVDK